MIQQLLNRRRDLLGGVTIAPSTSLFGSLSGTSKWRGGVLAPNGKIYGIPLNSTQILEILNVGTATSAMTTMPSPISTLATSIYNRHQNKY